MSNKTSFVSYSKIWLYDELLNSDVPDDKSVEDWVIGYFPDDMQKLFADEILSHRLKREIIATRMTSAIINRFGPTMVYEIMQATQRNPSNVAQACFFTREAFDFKSVKGIFNH